MAISLKQLYLLPEYWTTTDFTHPDTGEKEPAQHWEPSSGYKLYRAPNIDVTKRAANDSKVREKSTQIFYDFYAMELLHALVGSSKGMSTGAKIKATLPTATRTGINPALIGIDWDNVEFPLGNAVLPEKLRSQIDTMYEEVTIALSNKLQEHLRRSLVQELRHLINHSSAWQNFRNDIIAHYNKTGSLTKEDLAKFVGKRIPGMSKHLDAVKRLLVFSRHYSKMGSDDPGDIATKDDPKPSKEKDDPSKYYDIEKDPQAVDISKKKEDEPEEEPGEEIPDYPGWEPDAGTADFDPEDPFSKKIKKQWKDKLKEDYASGKISPSTIRTINKAIHKAGLKWEDIVLAYNNIDWNGGYGGEKWGEGVVSYLKLVQASKNQDIDKMAATIDHIYDLSHNNGPLLNKGGMYVAAEDLDRRSKVTHIARFLPNVSPVVRTLVLNVMRYLPGTNVEVEKNIDTFLNAPTVPFSEEQKKILAQHNLSPYMGDVYVGNAPFTNKQGNYVDRKFLVKAHTNSKFTIGDSMKADSKVFDTFEQLEKYLTDVISKEVEPSYGGSSASSLPPAATTAGEVDNYVKSHTRVKLPSDKAQQLFDKCKMGWREKGQCYKAYFTGGKRALFYAFLDGTYLSVTNEYNSFNPTSNWDAVLEFTKQLTINAIPYPEPEMAKAHIAAGTSKAPITTPGTTPSPSSAPITGIDVQSTFAPPKPPAIPQASVTPTAYPSIADQLPSHSASPAAYSVHSGISSAPTKTIRLTKPDEDVIVNLGFKPKLINGMIWYIHSGTGDTIKFFPNNTGKLLFTSTGKGGIPVVTFAIPKMLQWLQQKYTSDTKTSPVSAPTPKPSTPTVAPATVPATTGINPGALFNPQIQAAGFTWDQSSGKYFDGQNNLLIKPDRSSVLDIYGGQPKYFKNLPELIAYLSDEYPAQKKTSTVEIPDSLSEFQFEQIKKSIEQFPNWKAEKYTDTFLIKQLEPNSKTYVTKYGISKTDKQFKLYDASLGTTINVSDSFGIIIETLINRISNSKQSHKSINPPNPLPLNNPETMEFPKVSESDATFTTEELKYIDAVVVSYGGGTNYNEHYISVVPPSNGNPLKGAKYSIDKKGGYYRIIQTVGENVLFHSPGFYSLVEKLKQILAEEGGTGGMPSAIGSDKPSPSGGEELPNPNYQAMANELVAEVANSIELTPEQVSKTPSFENTPYVIPVIKAIRTFYNNNTIPQGLGCAKLAAFYWQDFLEYIRDHGLPLLNGANFEFEMLIKGYKKTKTHNKRLTNNNTVNKLIQTIVEMTGISKNDVIAGKFPPGQKIPVIKAIRTYYSSLGKSHTLLGAKLAIEHWADFIAYVRDHGLPDMGDVNNDNKHKGDYSKNPDVSYFGYSTTDAPSSSKNPLAFIDDEKEWITTYFANHYPNLEVDLAPDGMIYINQPDPNVINEITKGYKPLFIIYKKTPTTYVIKTMVGGEIVFNSFGELGHFIYSSIGSLIPAAPKTSQQSGWEKALEHNYGGVNMDGVSTGANLGYHGFGWSEKNEAYVNNKLHQLVVIKPQIGFNSFNIYWVNKNGNLNAIKTNNTAEVYSTIGPRGVIEKDQKEIEAGAKKASPYTKAHLPTPEQEGLLTKIGFVKNTTQTLPDDPISYTKPSDDSGNAYFTVEIDPYTGKAEYTEVDEEGTSEGYSYQTLGHALSFLKNKFADKLNDNEKDKDSTYDSDLIEHISDVLTSVGFKYKNTDGDIYEFFTDDGSEYIGYNILSGNLTYGIAVPEQHAYNVVKSFYDIDDFVAFYNSKSGDIETKETIKPIEKFGFSIISNSHMTTVFKKPPQNGVEHFISHYKTSGNFSYDIVDVEDDHTISTKKFSNINEMIEYLKYKFEFHPPAEVPYSGADYKISFSGISPYQPIRLNTFDESTLMDMGFNYDSELFIGNIKMGGYPIYVQGYRTANGNRLIVYGSGGATYQATDSDSVMRFENVKAALQYLWAGIDWNNVSDVMKNNIKWSLSKKPEPPAKSGDMPYSGYNYSLISILFDKSPTETILLDFSDNETLTNIGFKSQTANTKDPAYKIFYTNGIDKVYFFADGRASYWKGVEGPYYFNTVKEAMKFLWNKHTTYIEEVASYKSFMKNWLE